MPPVVTGQQFSSFSEFKKAVSTWSIEDKFAYRVDKSDRGRTVIKCRMKDCPFLVRAFYDMEENCVVVDHIKADHICYGAGEFSRTASSQHKWLVENLPSILTIDNKTTPSVIVQAVLHKHHEKISAAAASKAKHAILGNTLKGQAAQYQRLPQYTHALQKTNPGTYTDIAISRTSFRFERIFICPPTSRESFRHCRPFLAVDGTFTKTQYIQTLLLAVTIDADNHACILAWALVGGETKDSWRYFLLHLKSAIPKINQPNVTVMSDRDKGN